MTDKKLDIHGFDSKKLFKSLQNKKALCPSCERILKLAGSLYIYDDKDSDLRIYYVICRKCEYKKERQTPEKKESIKKIIEKRISENMHPYACEAVDDPNMDKILNKVKGVKQNLKINALESTTGIWHKNDADFFKNNKGRRFYARKIFEGELYETNKTNESLQKDAFNKNISYALIHEVAPQQRVYTYTSDLDGHPFDEEAFVAAMFMVRVNNLLTPDDIYDMYEQIKANDDILNEFNLTDLNKL